MTIYRTAKYKFTIDAPADRTREGFDIIVDSIASDTHGHRIGRVRVANRTDENDALHAALADRALYKLRYRIALGYTSSAQPELIADVVQWIASNYGKSVRIVRNAIESSRLANNTVPLDGRQSDWIRTLDELSSDGLQHLITLLYDDEAHPFTHQNGAPMDVETIAVKYLANRARHRFIAHAYYGQQSSEYGYTGTDISLDTPVEWTEINDIEFSELLEELTDELTNEQVEILNQLIAGESMRTVAGGAGKNHGTLSRLVARVRAKYVSIDGVTMPRTLSRCDGEITPAANDYSVYIK